MIDAEGARYGYYMKTNKGTYLLGRCGSYEQAREEKQNSIDQFGFEESLIHLHPSDVALAHGLDQNWSICNRKYGVKVLGTWVGTPEYIKSNLQNKVVEIQHEKTGVFNLRIRKFAILCFVGVFVRR